VREGDKVLKGAVIARVGKTGNADTYHLHFEVRQGKAVRNPLFFLP
jgi:murein DD-endopeptidase MepM/ murein hydrolase activator NlpD